MGYGAIELQTSWHIFCLNFYWNESKPSFGMCPFLRNFARLPHINFIYLDTWRYAEAYCVKKTQLFDKSTKARTSWSGITKYYMNGFRKKIIKLVIINWEFENTSFSISNICFNVYFTYSVSFVCQRRPGADWPTGAPVAPPVRPWKNTCYGAPKATSDALHKLSFVKM